MRYNLDSTLPIRAFQKRLALFGSSPATLEGGGGGDIISDVTSGVSNLVSSAGDAVSSVGDAVSNAVQSVGSVAQDVASAVSNAGVAIDQTVNNVIPGGWATVGAIAATVATAGAAGAAVGATEAGAEVGTGAVAEAGASAAVDAGAVSTGAVNAAVDGATVAGDTLATGGTVADASVVSPLETMASQAPVYDFSTPLSTAENQAIQTAAQSYAPEFSGQQLVNQLGGGALRGATTSALKDLATGNTNNLGQDIAIGGLSGAVGAGVGNVATQGIGATPILSGALQGATSSGINASLHGSPNVLGAIESGGVAGGAGGGAQMIGQNLGVTNPVAQGALSGAVQGGANAALSNKSIGTGALIGGIGGGAGSAGALAGNTLQNDVTGGTGNTLLGQVLGNVAGGSATSLTNNALGLNTPTTFASGTLNKSATGSPTQSTYGNPVAVGKSQTNLPTMASSYLDTPAVSMAGGQAGIPVGSNPVLNTGSASNIAPTSGLDANGLPAQLQAGVLQNSNIPADTQMKMAQLVQLHPELAQVHPTILSNLIQSYESNSPVNAKNGGHIQKLASGGSPLSYVSPYDRTSELFKPAEEPRNSKVPYGNPTGNYWHGLYPTHLKNGGQEHGEHIPEFITGATGHYVKGKGDGQSDDIPAMLADGEYVFDADTVAQLGNGSSDAGAKLLDHFRESLREHKRSASADKIPPKANPLAYMKEALKRHKG